MNAPLTFLAAVVVFVVGLRLSAFFSGSETGFYRVNFLRLSIDAHSGDKVAERLMWFSRNPSSFVATTLIGNNIANYLTTFAIGVGSVTLLQTDADWVEIVSTLVLSPVVFLFGELLPKNLYYRAPMFLLKRGTPKFLFFYRLFRVFSIPLVALTKLLERLGGTPLQTSELVLGRKRLVQVLSQGHREGLLTAVQSNLVHGVLHTAGEPVTDSMTPADRVFGLDEEAAREDVLSYARRYGITSVAIKRAGSDADWYGYLRVVDAAVIQRPLHTLIQPMPRLDPTTRKLEALLVLRDSGAAHAVVCEEDRVLGIVSERGLVEQLMRPPQTLGTRLLPSEL